MTLTLSPGLPKSKLFHPMFALSESLPIENSTHFIPESQSKQAYWLIQGYIFLNKYTS